MTVSEVPPVASDGKVLGVREGDVVVVGGKPQKNFFVGSELITLRKSVHKELEP